MSYFSDAGVLEELEWFVNCLIEDNVPYTVAVKFNSSDQQTVASVSNGRVTLNIKRVNKKIVYVVCDEDAVRHARIEGFSERQILENVNCYHKVDEELAEVMLTKPDFFAECKREAIKDNVKKDQNST